MSINNELFEEFRKHLADKYTAVELCELLNLSEWDLLEAFIDKVLELDINDY